MNDFQEQAKNWLRNVVKQNPDKIKAGVEKAGDLIDKQTGGKYADKVDAVQEKVGGYVDSQASDAPATPGSSEAPDSAPGETPAQNQSTDAGTDTAESAQPTDETAGTETTASGETAEGETAEGETAGADDTVDAGETAATDPVADPDGGVVGGEVPDVAEQPSSSAGSGTEGADTGGTATGTSDGGLPGPRSAE